MAQKAEGTLKLEKDKFQTAATEVTLDHIGNVKIIPKPVSPDSNEAEEVSPPPTPGKLVTRRGKGLGGRVLEVGRLSGPGFLWWPGA